MPFNFYDLGITTPEAARLQLWNRRAWIKNL
jgi:hypothetical protein